MEKEYDEILFPPLECVPRKYAILHRNKWMVEQADFIFFYVSRSWGGAYRAYEYALKLKKASVNISDVITNT